jgi:HrpA-like RNA helicase
VTIPDVVIVLDSGRVRELVTDKRTGSPKLIATWCSRASVKQRSGRAGRVQPGLCLKLFSTKTEQYTMNERSEPELRRVPLEEVCLNILATGSAQSCRAFLRLTPQPPTDRSVDAALMSLYEIGAVSFEESLSSDNSVGKESVTPLGQILGRLPLEARLGKMVRSIWHCLVLDKSTSHCRSSCILLS